MIKIKYTEFLIHRMAYKENSLLLDFLIKKSRYI